MSRQVFSILYQKLIYLLVTIKKCSEEVVNSKSAPSVFLKAAGDSAQRLSGHRRLHQW